MSYLRILRLISPRTTSILCQQKQCINFPSFAPHRTCYEQTREYSYKNFGHKPRKEPIFSKIYFAILLVLLIFASVDWRWCRVIYLDRMEKRRKKKMGIEDTPEGKQNSN